MDGFPRGKPNQVVTKFPIKFQNGFENPQNDAETFTSR
jgi:hypothetical protein